MDWTSRPRSTINLQDVAETSLYRTMQSHNADQGTVVVMEVSTSHIKAISNLSSDGNGGYLEEFNHAVGGSFEPGSTFKLATMLALLEDTNIELSTPSTRVAESTLSTIRKYATTKKGVTDESPSVMPSRSHQYCHGQIARQALRHQARQVPGAC